MECVKPSGDELYKYADATIELRLYNVYYFDDKGFRGRGLL